MIIEEQWKPFEDHEVSNFGNVKTLTGFLCKTLYSPKEGYKVYTFRKKSWKIYKVVAMLFCDWDKTKTILHMDKNMYNDRFDNLICVSKDEAAIIRKDTRELLRTYYKTTYNIDMTSFDAQ